MLKASFCRLGTGLLLVFWAANGVVTSPALPPAGPDSHAIVKRPRQMQVGGHSFLTEEFFELKTKTRSTPVPSPHVVEHRGELLVDKIFSKLKKRATRDSSFATVDAGNKSAHLPGDDSPEWQEAVRKGTDRLKQLTDLSCAQPPVHTFNAPYPNDLEKWGWDKSEFKVSSDYYFTGPFQLLQLSVDGANRVLWGQQGSFKRQNGDEKRRYSLKMWPSIPWQPTFGYFQNVYNARQGWIIAESNKSPAKATGKTGDDLPDLQRWSDVTWLEWAEQCRRADAPPAGLKYVFRQQVVTTETEDIMDRALKQRGFGREEWPGAFFDMAEDEGKALLGTVHGTGPVFLLADHREELQGKVVKGVYVFDSKGSRMLL